MSEIISYAPLLASTIAVAALLSGLWQFRKTQRLVRETKAIDLFLKFNEINDQLSKAGGAQSLHVAFWQHNALLAMTEAVFKLTEGDVSWGVTVVWMIQTQQGFLVQNPVNCQSFSPEFVKLLKQSVPQLRCA